jgi:hypothetical protein
MSGICRICKCSPDNRCNIGSGDECGWLTAERDVCTNPKCIVRYMAERRNGRRAIERTRREAVAPIRNAYWDGIRKKREEAAAIRRRHRKQKERA